MASFSPTARVDKDLLTLTALHQPIYAGLVMRHIHVEEGLRLRFPGRAEEFNEGVEIGLLVAHMASGQREIRVRLARGTLEQARALAAQMGYRVHLVQVEDTWAEAMLLTGQGRPNLKLVHSSPASGSPAINVQCSAARN